MGFREINHDVEGEQGGCFMDKMCDKLKEILGETRYGQLVQHEDDDIFWTADDRHVYGELDGVKVRCDYVKDREWANGEQNPETEPQPEQWISLYVLLPCPFCGQVEPYVSIEKVVVNPDGDSWASDGRHRFQVMCGQCAASSALCKNEADAASHWNRRTG